MKDETGLGGVFLSSLIPLLGRRGIAMSLPPTPTLPPPARHAAPRALDVRRIREDFPILRQRVHGKPLVYLDNAATAQKPQAVIDSITSYYVSSNANIHRGVHALSEQATASYEHARVKIQRFINAADPSEIVFVRGTTEGINLVA